ncbi:MAG: glycosyltransferase [Geminicoccaceae bacterium]
MANQDYEIIFLGDLRAPHFQTMVADQIRAVVAGGYQAAILQVASNNDRLPARIHPDIRELIDSNRLAHLDPNQTSIAKLIVCTDASCFASKTRRIVRAEAPLNIVLVPIGTALDDDRWFDEWPKINQNATHTLSGEIIWAPMSQAVREQLSSLPSKQRLNDSNWYPCIDFDEWHIDRTRFCASRPVIGRSGPLSIDAWPVDPARSLSLFPDDPQFLVRLLNGGTYLRDQLGFLSKNWDILTLDDTNEREFLSSIDFFVHSYNPKTVSLPDPYLLRAVASGAVAILPASLEKIFGDGAVYAEPQEVKSKVWHLYNDRARYLTLSQAGTRRIKADFSFQRLTDRIADMIGAPARHSSNDVVNVRPQQPHDGDHDRRRVMFITINGVGMGHLTRMLAIAKRCRAPIEPIFVTMSQALKVLREQGYLVEFIPSRQYLDCDIGQWNKFLRDELNEMIAFYDPAVVVFDGNVPYQGITDAINTNADLWSIWSRRGMWRSDNKDIISRERFFDIVLEPGDLAGADDHGITTRHQERTHYVRPIRLLDKSEMLSRQEARQALGMDDEKPAVLVQLGAGNNYDYRSVHNTALKHMQDRYEAQIAVGEWLISDQPVDLPQTVTRMPGYPFARYFNAFDFAISAVGYNSFHELLLAGVPTIFIPNENMQQDNQLARALYADRYGLAICVRAKEIYCLTPAIDRLFDPSERNLIESRLAQLDPANGAAEAAALIHELAYSHRVIR